VSLAADALALHATPAYAVAGSSAVEHLAAAAQEQEQQQQQEQEEQQQEQEEQQQECQLAPA